MKKLKDLLRNLKFKLKKTNNILKNTISTSAILVDITDIRNLYTSYSNIDSELYNLFWRDGCNEYMKYIYFTFYLEITKLQLEDLVSMLSKSNFTFEIKYENNMIKALIQGNVMQFRNYIHNSKPTECESIYKLIVRLLYQTHCIYFTDMINDGVFIGNQFNTIYDLEMLKDDYVLDHNTKIVEYNNIYNLKKISKFPIRDLYKFTYFIVKNGNSFTKYSLVDLIMSNMMVDGHESKVSVDLKFFSDKSHNLLDNINYNPLYINAELDDYFDSDLDEILEEDNTDDKSEGIDDNYDMSEIMKSFYDNGGVNIYEETDYKEV